MQVMSPEVAVNTELIFLRVVAFMLMRIWRADVILEIAEHSLSLFIHSKISSVFWCR